MGRPKLRSMASSRVNCRIEIIPKSEQLIISQGVGILSNAPSKTFFLNKKWTDLGIISSVVTHKMPSNDTMSFQTPLLLHF